MNTKAFDFRWLGLLLPLLIACGLSNTPDLHATVVAGIDSTQTAQVSVNIPTAYPTPYTFAYATPAPYTGIGPFTIPAQDSVLLKIHPVDDLEPISFVKSLTLYVKITDPVVRKASTLDYMLWAPGAGGWSANSGSNKLVWGENNIKIKYPDVLVSRQGEIVLDIRNWGSKDESIQWLSAALVAQTIQGEEVTY